MGSKWGGMVMQKYENGNNKGKSGLYKYGG